MVLDRCSSLLILKVMPRYLLTGNKVTSAVRIKWLFTVSLWKQTEHHCTIYPDDAVSGGLGPFVICDSHGVHATVLLAVPIELKRGLLLLHIHAYIRPSAGTLGSSAGASGQRLPLRRNSSFGLPFPGYHGDVFKGSVLQPSFQNQAGAGDHVQGFLVEDVHWHTVEPVWHCGGTRDGPVRKPVVHNSSHPIGRLAVGHFTLCKVIKLTMTKHLIATLSVRFINMYGYLFQPSGDDL